MHQLFGGPILCEYGCFTRIDLFELPRGPILGLSSIDLFALRRSFISSQHRFNSMRQLCRGKLPVLDGNLCMSQLSRGLFLCLLWTLNFCSLCHGAVFKLKFGKRVCGLRRRSLRFVDRIFKLFELPRWYLSSEHWKHHMHIMLRGNLLVRTRSCTCIHM